MSRLSLMLTLALCLLLLASSAQGSDWPRFRGPNGSGISSDKAPMPVVWSESKNLKWKRALPGPGSSCPIVLGDRIFVTSWSGYGLSQDNPGEQTQLRAI
ncbi:MAG: PQQ-binding-like beta-propeller repeat protein [Pirellulales bacterium]